MLITPATFNGKEYQVCNGTYYNAKTSIEVIANLETIRSNGTRIVLDYGDTENGREWGDGRYKSLDVGTIGRSMGPVKIPILVSNSRSMGGGGILDNCIVRIRASKGKGVLYQHPTYHLTPPGFETWKDDVTVLLGGRRNCVDMANPMPSRIAGSAKAETMFLNGSSPEDAAKSLAAA